MTQDEAPYVDNLPDEPPAPDVPQTDRETPKNGPVPETDPEAETEAGMEPNP